MLIIQNELMELAREWNTHKIRPNHYRAIIVALQCKCTMKSTEVNGTELVITRKMLHHLVAKNVLIGIIIILCMPVSILHSI